MRRAARSAPTARVEKCLAPQDDARGLRGRPDGRRLLPSRHALVAKKRDGGVERCLRRRGVCSVAVLRATTSRATSRGGPSLARPACGAADKTEGALGVIALVLERLIGEDGAEVDEQVWTALSDAVVPRVHDKVAGVRQAACLALRRHRRTTSPRRAWGELGERLVGEVRAAAARALDPSKKTVDCPGGGRDVNATVRSRLRRPETQSRAARCT